jgi:prophage maintenance system killer protein
LRCVALELFIKLNGLRFPVSDADAVIMTSRLAAGDIAEAEFITWIRSNVVE